MAEKPIPADALTPSASVLMMLIGLEARRREARLTDGQIAEALGLSLPTVRRALADLEKEGLIRRSAKDGVRTLHLLLEVEEVDGDG